MKSNPLEFEELSTSVRKTLVCALESANVPSTLYYSGNLDLLAKPMIAFVGSRQASPLSLTVIEALAGEIASSGACIISGGALGIDTASHLGALQAGGATILIVPCPLEHIDREKWRRNLSRHLDDKRCLFLSLFSPQSEITRGNPLVRNRLIASLASAAVVGETAMQSGTNHFTRCALELRTPVFFLRREESVGTEQKMIYRHLEQRGAHPFGERDALGSSLPRKILSAASEFSDWRDDQDSVQLRLCEDEEEYLTTINSSD